MTPVPNTKFRHSQWHWFCYATDIIQGLSWKEIAKAERLYNKLVARGVAKPRENVNGDSWYAFTEGFEDMCRKENANEPRSRSQRPRTPQ